MLKNHIKTAWRNMVFHRISTLVNLAGLSLGMTAAFLIFMWVENEYNYNAYHPESDSIYRLTRVDARDVTDRDERTPYLFGQEIKNSVPEIKTLARIFPLSVFKPTVEVNSELFSENTAAYVDESWFSVFHFDFIRGSAQSFNSVPNGVVISQSHATKYFADDNPIGKPLKVNGIDCIVKGVLAPDPSNSSFRYDVYVSDKVRIVNASLRENMSFADSYQTFIKIAPSSSPESALKKINSIAPDEWNVSLVPLKDIHFESLRHSFLKHGDQKLANILLILGVLLLAIACINYVNLTTAKASVRMKEVGVKKIVGAGRMQLFIQFVVESALISMIALLITLLFVLISLPAFNRFTDNNFTLSLADLSLWELLAVTSLCTLLFASIYPAILLSSFKPAAMLKGAGTEYSGDGSLRKALVVIQFAISIALVVSTFVINQQMKFIQAHNDNAPQLFSFMYRSSLGGDARVSQMEIIRLQLLGSGSIENVALTSGSDIINRSNLYVGAFDWEGRTEDVKNEINFIPVGTSFDELNNVKLTQGRWFRSDSRHDQKNFILNETAVKELGIRQPVIGQRFSLMQDSGVVIGVVEDFHYLGLHERIGPMVFGNNPFYANSFLVKSRPDMQAEALQVTEKVWKHFNPDQPFEYQFATDQFELIYRADLKAASLITAFSILAIFISCLGLYALSSFSAERRKKEIGIRKVLGASVTRIARTLTTDFAKLVVLSMLIAFPLGWWAMHKWLQTFAYHVDIHWWIFALAGILALIIAVLTISFHAIKAALMNPVRSLRSE